MESLAPTVSSLLPPQKTGNSRSRLLRLVFHEHLQPLLEDVGESFTVIIKTESGTRICYSSRPSEFGQLDESYTQQHQNVLSCFGDDDLTVGKIARLTGYANSSRLRQVLSDLVKEKLLVKTGRGYRLV